MRPTSPFKGKNILYVWDADYPWDIRVEKICDSLSRSGHNVHISSRNLKNRPEHENINNLQVHRLRGWENHKINYSFSFPLFFSPVWIYFLSKTIIQNKIDLIIVRDLPLSPLATFLGKIFHIPVIFDMAEDYPAMLAGINRVSKSLTNKIVRNPKIASLIEKIVCRYVDTVLVVVHESKKRLLGYGIDSGKIEIVSNTPNLNFLNFDGDFPNHTKNDFEILYIGGIQMGRGLQTVIKSLQIIAKVIPNTHFKVIGDGYAINRLKELAIACGVKSRVNFTGFVDHKLLPRHITSSDICIIPHVLNEHTKTTIPNKLFDYMALGKPVVATDIPPITRILETEKCGLVFHNKDHEDLARKIILLKGTSIRNQTGMNGLNAIKKRYNWEVDFARLKKTIDKAG